LDPDTHCAIIQTDKSTGMRTLKEIVKNDQAGPPDKKVKAPVCLKGRVKTALVAEKIKTLKPLSEKALKLKTKNNIEKVILNEDEISYLARMARLRSPIKNSQGKDDN
jgi:hypothetical protein